jgi:hypothetical protein
MQTIKIFSALIAFLFMSCEKNEIDSVNGLTDGFCIVVNDKVVLNHTAIDYYDFSEHKIYLRNGNSFLEGPILSEIFTVYADMDSVYSGHFLSSISSYLPTGAVIYTDPFLQKNNTIKIGCIFITDEFGTTNIDPRSDNRIIEALKKYNQFR